MGFRLDSDMQSLIYNKKLRFNLFYYAEQKGLSQTKVYKVLWYGLLYIWIFISCNQGHTQDFGRFTDWEHKRLFSKP